MDKPISVGDLVMVVSQCCRGHHIGKVAKVIRTFTATADCPYCGSSGPGKAGADLDEINDWGFSLSWLKRIPPLDELEGEKRDEEITA